MAGADLRLATHASVNGFRLLKYLLLRPGTHVGFLCYLAGIVQLRKQFAIKPAHQHAHPSNPKANCTLSHTKQWPLLFLTPNAFSA